MARRLLSGGEAIAHAALTAGASMIAGYPTDSLSQLIEAAIRQVAKGNADGAHAEWTVNDKTTLGICAAESMAGLRSLAAFGHAGLSEVIQGLAALNYSQIQGGLIALVADEPSSDAYTANLDVRRICELAKIPVIDPETPELAYSAVSAAFLLSERYNMPVVIHMSQDINYSSAFFDIQPHTKAALVKGAFLKNKKTLDVTDLIAEEPPENVDFTDDGISDIDVRLKEIAYRFSYKDTFAIYNRIFEFEQQNEGKHNSRRFQNGDEGSSPEEESPIMKSISRKDEAFAKIGICVCGSAAPYVIEAIETLLEEAHKSKVSTPMIRILTLGTPFPVPKRTLRKFLEGLSDILVIEEFSSFAEEELIKQCATNFLGPSVHGRSTGDVNYNYPINFESSIMHIAAFIDKCLNPKSEKIVYDSKEEPELSPVINMGKHSSPSDAQKSLTPKQSRTLTGIARKIASPESIYFYNSEIPERLPVLCSGCPHRASFYAIENALDRLKISRKDVVFSGDVGCSLLGNNSTLNLLDAYLGEGFSASLGQGFTLGASSAGENMKSISIIGDSSFFSSAIPSMVNVVANNTDLTLIVLDNKICAESGLQPTPTTFGTTDIADVLRSLGIHNVREADPFETGNALDACVKAIRDPNPSAVVLSSKCARMVHSNKVTHINTNKCTGCKECITRLSCPAIYFDKNAKGKKSGNAGQAVIDIDQCNGCRLCIGVCPSEAIRTMAHKDVVELLRQERDKSLVNLANADSGDGEQGKGADEKGANDGAGQNVAESTLNLFTKGTLYVLDEEDRAERPENDSESEAASADDAHAKKPLVSKQLTQADFGTLFGGKNAELTVTFDDDEPTGSVGFDLVIETDTEEDSKANDADAATTDSTTSVADANATTSDADAGALEADAEALDTDTADPGIADENSPNDEADDSAPETGLPSESKNKRVSNMKRRPRRGRR